MNHAVLLHYALPPLLALAFVASVFYFARRQRSRLHTRGLHLIYWLKAYSAWVDCQRDEPFDAKDFKHLASPEPLSQALRIKDAAFPELSQPMVRLQQAHSRLIEHLWQQRLLRIGDAAGCGDTLHDAQYQQIRGAQEDLIEEMIAFCQERIGESAREWRRTSSDFSLSSGVALTTPQEPVTRS